MFVRVPDPRPRYSPQCLGNSLHDGSDKPPSGQATGVEETDDE